MSNFFESEEKKDFFFTEDEQKEMTKQGELNDESLGSVSGGMFSAEDVLNGLKAEIEKYPELAELLQDPEFCEKFSKDPFFRRKILEKLKKKGQDFLSDFLNQTK